MVRTINDYKVLKQTFHDYIVLDIETTGLDVGLDSITEVGMIKVVNDEIVDTYDQLVHPMKSVPPRITELTGITNEMLKDQPYIEEVIYDIIDFIGDFKIMGHHVSVDLAFLSQHDSFFDQYYIDTLTYAKLAFPYLSSFSLANLTEEFSLTKNTHRALADVYATKALYDLILQKRGSIEKLFSYNPYTDPCDYSMVEAIDVPSNNPFNNQRVLISGYTTKMAKSTMYAILEKCGAIVLEDTSADMTMLIIGEHQKEHLSEKHQNVLYRIENNQPIQIMDQNHFYAIIGL